MGGQRGRGIKRPRFIGRVIKFSTIRGLVLTSLVKILLQLRCEMRLGVGNTSRWCWGVAGSIYLFSLEFIARFNNLMI